MLGFLWDDYGKKYWLYGLDPLDRSKELAVTLYIKLNFGLSFRKKYLTISLKTLWYFSGVGGNGLDFKTVIS